MKITCDSPAFALDARHEVANLLRAIVDDVETGDRIGQLVDRDGSVVGSFLFVPG